MGATPIYALPWPEQSDPPDGPVQFKALADRTELSLTAVRGAPTVPTFAARTTTDSALPGNRVYSNIHFNGQRILGTSFINMPAAPAASWAFTQSGVYEIVCKLRMTAATAPGSYAQMYGGSTGALAGLVVLGPWAGTTCELLLHEYLEVTAGMVNLASNLQIQSDANVAFNIAGPQSRLIIKRLGDIGAVVPGPG